jgi:PAS domain S-box-containing protein
MGPSLTPRSQPIPSSQEPAGPGESAQLAGLPNVQAWLAAIVDSSDDAIIGKSLDSTILSWNAAATRLFGYEASEIIGQSVLTLFPPELRHEEPEIIARLARGDRVDHYETIRVRKDGSRVAISLSVSPIRDASGAVVGGAKIARDITERRRADARIREQAELLDLAQDAIVVRDADGRITFWNAAAERTYGWTLAEVEGRSVHELLRTRFPEDREEIQRSLRDRREWMGDLNQTRREGGELVMSSRWAARVDGAGHIVAVLEANRDVTDARRLEQAERELTEQLQEQAVVLEQQAMELEQQVEEAQSLTEELEASNKQLEDTTRQAQQARVEAETANRTKSEFLAVMSHELRTPLNAIIGYVDLMELGLRGPVSSEQTRDLERIRRSSRTLLQLIEDVLSFAKLESGRIEYRITDVPVGEMLEDFTLLIAPQVQAKGLEFSTTCTNEALTIRADRDKVERIVLNLLSNAVKFTDRGRIELRCDADESEVRIVVADTGRGIPADQLETIFEPFVQVERSLNRTAEGTGLGLSIARDLAKGMGGTLVAESTQGSGSSFTLRLPRS